MSVKKNKKIIKSVFVTMFLTMACLLSSSIDFANAKEPPLVINRDDGGTSNANGVSYQFFYKMTRKSYDPIHGTAVYELTEHYVISGGYVPIVSDIVHLTNRKGTDQYIGEFKSGNSASKGPGTYYRSEKFTLNLVEGINKIKIRGEYDGNDSGDADFTINIDKFGHEPVVHGTNGTWVSGEVSSGKRTYESLYTDGAAGSAAGNKTQTSTGFSYTDEDEQKTATYKYSGKTLGNNAKIKSIKKNGADVAFSALDKPGTYVITSCTKDSAENEACGTRNIVVKSKYQVKYNGNTATSGSMSNSTHVYDTAKALSANGYSKTGYRFKSWNTKADGTGTTYTNQQSVKNLTSTDNGVVNLYAQWNANTYTIKYHGNNATSGSMADTTHTYDVSKTLRKNAYKRTGWKFMGWNTKADGSGTAYTDEKSVKNLTATHGGVINLYAQWDKAPSLTTIDKEYYQNEVSKDQWLSELRLQGITADDNEDGNLTSAITIVSDNVILNRAGTYTVMYQVTDSANQTVRESATITIKYNNPPQIQAENKMFYLGEINESDWETEKMREVSASDIEDGNLTDKIKIQLDEVNTSVAGTYRVSYVVVDRFGKKAENIIFVEIRFNNKPVIESENLYFHENEYTREQILELLESNASAYDSEDGDLTEEISIIKNDVDPSAPGVYEVIYQVQDSRGEVVSKTIDVTVMENDAPTLQLFAPSKRFIEGEYTQTEWENELRMIGVSAHDRQDHDLTDKIVVISDTTIADKAGTYEVMYRVTDNLGKSTTKKAKVTVEPNNAPIIYANDKYFKTTDIITEKDLLRYVYASDDEDGDLSKEIEIIENEVKSGQVGVYDVTYRVIDRFGKESTKTIQVHIQKSGNTPTLPVPPLPTDPDVIGIWNGRHLAQIHLTKLLENSDIDFDENAINEIVFGVYAAEDIIYQGNVVLKADSLIGISNINANGDIDVMIYHQGRYYAKELETADNYILDNTKYYFDFELR